MLDGSGASRPIDPVGESRSRPDDVRPAKGLPEDVGNAFGYFFPAGMSAADAPVCELTDVCFHALDIDQDGRPIVKHDEEMATLAERANAAGTTPHLQVGGMDVDFAPAVENARTFAAEAINVMEEYGYRGFAVDWEYPDDGDDFATLMGALDDELETRGGGILGGAVSALPYIADEAYAVEAVGPKVDYLVIMSYDFAGPWSDITGHHSATFSTEHETYSVESAIEYWRRHPIADDKLRAGIPFYGRSFDGVAPENDGYAQPFENGRAHSYPQVVGLLEDSDFEQFFDDGAGVPYAYSETEETFLSFESPTSVSKKVEVAADEIGGVGVWAINQDPNRDLVSELG